MHRAQGTGHRAQGTGQGAKCRGDLLHFTFCILHFVFCISPLALPSGEAGAEWGWYAGDVCVRAGRDIGLTLPERIQEGIDGGFDWLVVFYPVQAGAFRGLSDVAALYEAEARRITPILGIGGEEGKGIWGEGVAFGVDPRSPVPADSLQAAVDWADSHRGVFILCRTEGRLEDVCGRLRGGAAFIGLEGTRWSADCEVGGAWDRLLKKGRRLFMVGSNISRSLRHGSKTYVWAKEDGPSEIVEGIRGGGAYVSERDGIRMDVRVNGAGMGSVVSTEGYANVRVFAAARHPISRISLVCDGQVVWELRPESTVVDERLRLPIGDGQYTYLRPIVESRAGGYRGMGNPVFLSGQEVEEEVSEGRASERDESETLFSAMGGALETAAALAPGPQRTVLSALLRDVRTRAFAAHALQNRPDLIPNEVLDDLLEDRDREVRLGAAYARVMRGGEDLSEALLGLLLDRDAAVRGYAARMIFQSRTPIPAESLLSFLADRDPAVRLYLAEAVDSRSDDLNVVNRLLEMLSDPDAGVSEAAFDKLAEMGARNFRVVTALAMALRSGNGVAADLLGKIGDRRILPDVEEVYLKAPCGDLKRRCFLALDRMGSPYPDRKKVTVRRGASPPQIDGVPSPGEWDGAASLDGLGSDYDGTSSGDSFTCRLTCDDRAIYVLLSRSALRADDAVRRLTKRDDPAIWGEDRLEISFDPQGERKERRTFVVSGAGAQLEARNGDVTWMAAWNAAVGRSGKTWNAECAIPFVSLGLDASRPGHPVGFNFSWVDVFSPSRISWSITYGAPENPSRFGDLIIAE